MAYSSGVAGDISENIEKLLSEQRESVSGSYPADFLYYPLTGDDGTPLVVKVDDAYLSAWMSRDESGEAFSGATLLTIDQVNEVYRKIPGGPSGKMNDGPSMFVNPGLDVNDPKREVLADSVTKVSYNIETGDVQTAKQLSDVVRDNAMESRRARREASRARASGEGVDGSNAAKFDTAIIPNSLVKDGNVSAEDLKQQLSGYQLISHIGSEAEEERNKIAATSLIINAVGKSVSRIKVTQGGAVAPDVEIKGSDELSRSGFSLETRLVSPYDKVAPSTPVKQPDAPTDSGFKGKMQGLIDAGAGSPKANNPFEAAKIQILTRGFDDIAKNLSKGTLSGDSAAVRNVDSLNVLFPEHSDVIASYALAEEADASTNPKVYLDQLQKKSPEATNNSAPVNAKPEVSDASEALQGMLNRVGDDVKSGERVSQVNRDVEQVLRHLKNVSGDADKLSSEGGAAVNYLNEQGMGEHAKIISDYAQDPSTYRQARSDLREVAVVSAPVLTSKQVADNKAWEDMAKNGSPDVSVTAAQVAGDIGAALSKLSDPQFVGNAIDKALKGNPDLAAMVAKLPGGDIKAEVMAKLADNNSPISANNSADIQTEISSRIEEAMKQAASARDPGKVGGTPLDTILDKLGKDVDNNASGSQINRDVGQVLRYLKSVSPVQELLQSESARAVDFLNEKGLTKHADIISDYAKDPSTFRDARSAIREVAANNVNSATFGQLASNVDNIDAQIGEFKAELADVGGVGVAAVDVSLDVSLAGMKA